MDTVSVALFLAGDSNANRYCLVLAGGVCTRMEVGIFEWRHAVVSLGLRVADHVSISDAALQIVSVIVFLFIPSASLDGDACSSSCHRHLG